MFNKKINAKLKKAHFSDAQKKNEKISYNSAMWNTLAHTLIKCISLSNWFIKPGGSNKIVGNYLVKIL